MPRKSPAGYAAGLFFRRQFFCGESAISSLLDAVWSLKLRVLSEAAWSASGLPRSKAVLGRQSAQRAEEEHLKSFLYSI